MHQPADAAAVVAQSQQDAPGRHAADEGARAVDRVDDPAVARVAVDRAVLLADDAVIGEARAQAFDQEGLDLAVGDRDRIEAAVGELVRHVQRLAEMAQRDAAGLLQQFLGKAQRGAGVGVVQGEISFGSRSAPRHSSHCAR